VECGTIFRTQSKFKNFGKLATTNRRERERERERVVPYIYIRKSRVREKRERDEIYIESLRMSYVKSESGAKKRKIDSESGLSTKEFKEMYSLDEDGLEIVDMDEDSVESAQEEKVDDDVVMIGNGPEVSEFPHSRHDCLIHPIQNRTKTFKKTKFCVNCYCFVCDVKVAECKHWNDHCMATNTSY
jgi:hypothetical protein